MRNAVIRKKRLKAERTVDDYMRMPQRIMIPHIEHISTLQGETLREMAHTQILHASPW